MSHRDLGFKYTFGSEQKELTDEEYTGGTVEPPNGVISQKKNLSSSSKSDADQQAERIITYVAQLLGDTPLTDGNLTHQNLNSEEGSYIGVPAGYTYLYQFAAHDMTHSLLEARPLHDASNQQTDLRREPLALETLFGGGPLGCRHAYDMRNEHGAYPLRLGEFRTECGLRTLPPRDLPRVYFSTNGAVSLGNDGKADHKVTDVLIADPRNDDNNLLAQMTVVFSRLYNALIKKTEACDNIPVRNRALAARTASIRIYRRILRADLMRRLIQADVLESYLKHKEPILCKSGDRSVSLEFRFAASRLAHSMVRPMYILNTPEQKNKVGKVLLSRILSMSSLHRWGDLPTPRNWMIDWELFFELPEKPVPPEQFNWALKFGPSLALAMTEREAGEPLQVGYPMGVPIRDFLRARTGETHSVKSLIELVRSKGVMFQGLDEIIDDDRRREMVNKGLSILEEKPTGASTSINECDRCALLNDPPLLFFLMIEADLLSGGRTYGPLGSILVGDAFVPVFEDADNTTRMAQDASMLEALAFGEGVEIATMPDLIRSLDRT